MAVIDVLLEAKQKKILNTSEVDFLKKLISQKWQALPLKSQYQNLCPLIIADYGQWIPKGLRCFDETNWLTAQTK